MTIRQMITEIRQQLAGRYPETEMESFVRILFGYYPGISPAQVHLSQDSELPSGAEKQIRTAVGELKKYRPLQYILGETEFYGLKFELTPDVLIPRPETEELTDWVIRQYNGSAGLTLVDMGTGSGCIAVALAANLPDATVWAVDVSDAALAIAQKNAVKNAVNVNFLSGDVLKGGRLGFKPGSLDVVVSNPPYVTPSEKQQMLPNVLEYEPHLALFTPEDDPFVFYGHIAAFGLKCLKDGGRMFFEINEASAKGVEDILKQNGYSDIILRKDMNGKWRMVSARLDLPCQSS
ncbi:MAG: peptide chain release factor N(5)-glutamine methyltransferase [Bacteroidales bacterium]|jgi:release factor glutamine methyltransferase|nr:peptide chain release factor N(5)-glutamine methyltransferase [Bacteroidales bacterium]